MYPDKKYNYSIIMIQLIEPSHWGNILQISCIISIVHASPYYSLSKMHIRELKWTYSVIQQQPKICLHVRICKNVAPQKLSLKMVYLEQEVDLAISLTEETRHKRFHSIS